MISISKSSICQNSVVIGPQVLIANLQTIQSFSLSGVNFGSNIFTLSSMMTYNTLYKTYFNPKKNIKFSSSNCCNKGHALFLSTTVVPSKEFLWISNWIKFKVHIIWVLDARRSLSCPCDSCRNPVIPVESSGIQRNYFWQSPLPKLPFRGPFIPAE